MLLLDDFVDNRYLLVSKFHNEIVIDLNILDGIPGTPHKNIIFNLMRLRILHPVPLRLRLIRLYHSITGCNEASEVNPIHSDITKIQ